jgi:beta-N-acetylhexosaminidase
MIMTAHVLFEPIDPDYPATMSEPVLHGILRERMKFDGAIITDDLEMKAIAANYSIEDVVVRGANAGVNLFSICHEPDLQNRAIDALIAAVKRGDVPIERVAEANRKIDALVATYAHDACGDGEVERLNSVEHRAVMARIEALEENGGANGNGNGKDPTRVVG